MFKRSQAPRGAFTLIEMLVVIGIIALLAAIMFPVFAKVREKGRQTICASNLRQMGLAFIQYTQDSGGRFPGSGDGYTAGTGAASCFASTCNGWKKGKGHWVAGPADDTRPGSFLAQTESPFDPMKDGNGVIYKASVQDGAIFPYVKEASMFYCPSDKYGQDKGLSYSMNCALTLLSQTRIRTPGDIVLLVDEQGPNDGFFWAVSGVPAAVSTGESSDELTDRHTGGGNLLFVDGHVKFYTNQTFPLDKTPDGLADKWKTSGSPRFHDRAFGPYGSSAPPGMGTAPYTNDFCDASKGPGSADGKGNFTP